MKKLILGIAVVVAGFQLRALAEEVVLFWQIPNGGAAEAAGYSYAQLYATVDGSGAVTVNKSGWLYTPSMSSDGIAAWASLADVSGSINSFFVEYFNDNSEKIGYSETAALDVLSPYLGNRQSNPPVPQAGVWNPGFTAVPEPTSGLLTLIGLAVLALRRKRV